MSYRVTDWILWARQRPGLAGQLWYTDDGEPSFVYIWMFERYGERFFQFSTDPDGEHVVDFEAHLRVALREFLGTVPAVEAPVVGITDGAEWVISCPFCGGEHIFKGERPTCGGLLGPLDPYSPLPPVTPSSGGLISNLEPYRAGQYVLRFSKAIRSDPDHRPRAP